MTTRSKYRELVSTLYRKTMDKELLWETSGIPDRPSLSVAGRVIILHESRNEEGEPLEVLTIKNDKDDVVESINDETFRRNETPGIEGVDSYYILMQELRELAYKQAVGADDAVDEIISQLKL